VSTPDRAFRLSLRGVLAATLRTLRARAGDVALACTLALGPFLVLGLTYVWARAEPPALLNWVSILATSWLYGTLAHLARGELDGAPLSFVAAAGAGRRSIAGVLGVSFLQLIAIAIGLVFAIVPGVFLWVWSFVALPACLFERLGASAALERSGELTTGNRLPILGIGVAAYLSLVGAVGLLVGPVVLVYSVLGAHAGASVMVVAYWALQGLWIAITTVAMTVVYARLRDGHVDFDRETMADVFR
jgi:hypothetical protein